MMCAKTLTPKARAQVASGVDASNVQAVLPYIDIYLVATGIERVSVDDATINFFEEAKMAVPVDVGHLDAKKVRELADAAHSYVVPPAAAVGEALELEPEPAPELVDA